MDDIIHKLLSKIKDSNRSHELSCQFKNTKNDKSKVALALNIMDKFSTVPQAKCETKDAEKSVKLKNEANNIFISCKNNVEELIKAWTLYSKSIAVAPNDSKELSLAYANRSAVLIQLHKYEECVEDIDRALKLNYPNHLKGKLLCRKIECLNILQRVDAIKVVDEAVDWLQNINICNDDKQKFEDKLRNVKNASSIKMPNIRRTKDLPIIICDPKIPCASEAIAINYNEEYGRHIVTTRRVEPGEVLIMEKPYATILSADEIYTHCSHCLQVHWAMISCEFCINAMYCSEKCKYDAWKQYHDIECSVLGYLLDLECTTMDLFSMRLAILALREAGNVEVLRSIVEKVDDCKDPYKKGFSNDGIYHSDKYCALYGLVTNAEKRSIADLFERALKAAIILYYLCSKTTLFGEKLSTAVNKIAENEAAVFIGGLILRHMQIIPSNVHSFEEERNLECISIGAEALPFCSLINHSCEPNVSRISTKDYMLSFAILPIEKGAQIYDNYGIHYAVMNKSQRKTKFKQFYFDCKCIACKEDWPMYKNILTFNELLSSKESLNEVKRALQKFDVYFEYATQSNIENKPYLLDDLAKMINTLLKYVPLPCREVNDVVETLKRILMLTYGNEFEIPKLN